MRWASARFVSSAASDYKQFGSKFRVDEKNIWIFGLIHRTASIFYCKFHDELAVRNEIQLNNQIPEEHISILYRSDQQQF